LAALRTSTPPSDLIDALESFIAQLDDNAELLLGIEEQDAGAWQPVLDAWRPELSRGTTRTGVRISNADFLQPKDLLHPHNGGARARGDFGSGADSDIIAPPGLLATLRRELAESGTKSGDLSYRIRRLRSAPAMLETLFANVEFLPGVMACKQFDAVQFGFGAGLFSVPRYSENGSTGRNLANGWLTTIC